MKQVFNLGGSIVVEDIDPPICDDNSVLVMNVFSVISVGTDRVTVSTKQETNLIKRLLKKANLKKGFAMVKEKGLVMTFGVVKKTSQLMLIPMGYSSSGRVISVGKNITNFAPGDLVACAGAGFATHGEIVSIPKNLICRIPEEVSLKEASFTTLGAIALQGIRRANLTLGETVVVTGLGLLGQLTCQMLTAAGMKVIGLDLLDERLDIAKENGATLTLNPTKADIESEIMTFTEGFGADAVIICVGTSSTEPVHQAMQVSRKKGRIVILGDVGMDLNRDLMYKKELDVLISTSYGPGRYDSNYELNGNDYPIGYVRWTENRNMQAFLDLLSNKKIDLTNLIEFEFEITKAKEAYSIVREKNPLGIVLSYKDDLKRFKTISRKTILIKTASPKELIKVAVIGAGSFAKGVHLPNLTKLQDVSLEAIVDRIPANARNTAKEFNAKISSTDFSTLTSDEIDLAVIASQHDTHAEFSINFANKGINVLVEKPLALSVKDTEKVAKAVKKKNIHLIVGFNRRFAPASQMAKKSLIDRTTPIIMTYRINSSKMSKGHWINDPKKGGGAIIGEGCHFYDYCNWLIGSEPVEFSASMISSNNDEIINQNNVVSTIKYKDGSVATVIYSAIGSPIYPKERIEIFNNGKVIVIDDYKEITIADKKVKKVKIKSASKGHFEMLKAYIQFLKGDRNSEDLPLIDEAVTATMCSFKILEAAKKK